MGGLREWGQIHREASVSQDLAPLRLRQIENRTKDTFERSRRQEMIRGYWGTSCVPEIAEMGHAKNLSDPRRKSRDDST